MDQSKKIKLWSSLGMRASFGMIAMDLAEKYPCAIVTGRPRDDCDYFFKSKGNLQNNWYLLNCLN